MNPDKGNREYDLPIVKVRNPDTGSAAQQGQPPVNETAASILDSSETELIFADPNEPAVESKSKPQKQESMSANNTNSDAREQERSQFEHENEIHTNGTATSSPNVVDVNSELGSDMVKSRTGQPAGCCAWISAQRRPDVEKGSDSDSELSVVEDADNQVEVVVQFSTTLYIFIFFMQQLGLIMSANMSLPNIWEDYFGWIRYPVLNIDFDFEVDKWQADVLTLLILYMAPLYVLNMFLMAMEVNGTNLEAKWSHLIFAAGLGVFGLLGITMGLLLMTSSDFDAHGAFALVFGGYFFAVFFYWIMKFITLEHIMVPNGFARGVEPKQTRIQSRNTELWVLQFVWTILFAPIVSGWGRVALFNENIYIRSIGGTIGLLVLLYMLIFITFVSYECSEADNGCLEFCGEYFVMVGPARGKIIPTAAVNSLTKPFKSWSWWFQTLFLVERLLLAFSESAFGETNSKDLDLTSSYVSLTIIVVFALLVLVFLPYLTGGDNWTDQIARVSNIIMLIFGIISTQNPDDNTWQLVIGSLMIINSLVMLVFWLYHFKPAVLVRGLWKRLLYWIAVVDWSNKHTFKHVEEYVQQHKNQKLKMVEWRALTLKQRLLSMCVKRTLSVKDLSDVESGAMNGPSTSEFVLVDSHNLPRETLKGIRRYGFLNLINLRIADLSHSSLDIDACIAFFKHPGLSILNNLTTLDLSHNNIQDAGVQAIAVALQKHSSLGELVLYDCNIGDPGIKSLGEALKNNSVLRTLNLYRNEITDDGAQVLFDCISENSSLRILNLRWNKLEVAGGYIGNCLAKNESLTELILRYNKLRYEAVANIADALKSNKTLAILELREQTTEGVPVEDDIVRMIPTALSKVAHNSMATCLQYNNVVRFIEEDEFLMHARDGSFFQYETETEQDVCEDSCSDIDGAGAGYNNDNNDRRGQKIIGWSEVAWEMVNAGYCAMLTTAISYLTVEQKKQLRMFINSSKSSSKAQSNETDDSSSSSDGNKTNADTTNGTTMMELVLTKGVSEVCAAVKTLHEHGFDLGIKDINGRILREAAMHHYDYNLRCWMEIVTMAYAERYKVLTIPPLYHSDSCKVLKAVNIYTKKHFVLKEVRNPNVLLRELKTRNELRQFPEYTTYIVDDIWNSTWVDDMWKSNTKLCMVMKQGDKNLFDALNTERFASQDASLIQSIAKNAAEALRFINSHGMIHGDFKPRNFLRINNNVKSKWKLIDFDSSVKHGVSAGVKASSGYGPPELAKFLFGQVEHQPVAAESYDVWSFGCVLYEMLTGMSLFAGMDSLHDDLILDAEKLELMNWSRFPVEDISAEGTKKTHELKSLGLVLANANKDTVTENTGFDTLHELKTAAQDLVRRCLVGNPEDRPSFNEILEHAFLAPTQHVDEKTKDEARLSVSGLEIESV